MTRTERFWTWFFDTRIGAWLGRDTMPTTEDGWRRWKRRKRLMFRSGAGVLLLMGVWLNLQPRVNGFQTVAGRLSFNMIVVIEAVLALVIAHGWPQSVQQRTEAARLALREWEEGQ